MKNIFILMALLLITFSTLKAQELSGEDMSDLEALEKSIDARTPPVRKISKVPAAPSAHSEVLSLGRDQTTGLLLGDYNLSRDRSRISLAYQFNSDLKDISDLSTFEIEYSHRFELAWLDLVAARTSATFKELSTYKPSALNNASQELLAETSEVLFLGAGISTRTRYFAEALNLDGWFETVGAQLGYAQFSENFSSLEFSGPAFRASASFYKRMSRSFHFGVKMSYNLASTKREANTETESSMARHLTLAWTSFGLELGYYF